MALAISDFKKVMNTASPRIIKDSNTLVSRPAGTLGQFNVRWINKGSLEKLATQNQQVRQDFAAALKSEYGSILGERLIQQYGLSDHPSSPLSAATIKQVIQTADLEQVPPLQQEFLNLIGAAPRDPAALRADTSFREGLSAHLDTLIAPMDRTQQQTALNELRTLVNELPAFIPKSVRELAHDIIDSKDRQIGAPGFEHLGPSKAGASNEHVMNRSISEIVMIGDTPYTPVYMTVYHDATSSSIPAHKDFSQDADGRILIHTGESSDSGSSGKSKKKSIKNEQTLWVGIGRPYRQVKWLEKYARQGDMAGHQNQPLLRSFLLPVHIANEIAKDTITEHNSKGSGKDMNVDKHYEANQYGIVNPESLELMREHALPGSLKTYTDGALGGQPDHWGDVVPATELRHKLGVPEVSIPGIDIFTETTPNKNGRLMYSLLTKDKSHLQSGDKVPKDAKALKDLRDKFTVDKADDGDIATFLQPWIESDGANPPNSEHLRSLGVPEKEIERLEKNLHEVGFVEKSTYKERADNLLYIVACHSGNDAYLPDNAVMPPTEAERLQVVADFCKAHKPSGLTTDVFINDHVAPWATQARIAEVISDNFESLREVEIGDLPDQTPFIDFSKADDQPIVGRHWPRETQLGQEHSTLLKQRHQLRSAMQESLDLIGQAYKDREGVSVEARRILQPMKNRLVAVLSDYHFKVGVHDHVKTAMPGYQMELADYRDALAAQMSPTHPSPALAQLIETLDRGVQHSKADLKEQLSFALKDIAVDIQSCNTFMDDSSQVGTWKQLAEDFDAAAAKLDGKVARAAFQKMIRLFSDEVNALISQGGKEFAADGQISEHTEQQLAKLPKREHDYAALEIVRAGSAKSTTPSAFFNSGVSFSGKAASLDTTGPVRETGIGNTGNSCYMAAGLNMLASVEPYRQLFNPDNYQAGAYDARPADWAAVQSIGPKVWAVMEDIRAGRAVAQETVSELLADMDHYHLLPAPSMAAIRIGQNAQTAQQDPNEVIFRNLLPLFDPTNSMSLDQQITTDFSLHLAEAVDRPDLLPGDFSVLDGNQQIVRHQLDPIVELPIVGRDGLDITSLEDALDAFQAQETIEGVRGTHQGAVIEARVDRSIAVQRAPDAITFTLRRGDGLHKDDHEVEAPKVLNFNGEVYDLKAVVNHQGATLSSGHYTAMTVNPVDGSWEHRDDSSVTPLKTPDGLDSDDTSAANEAHKNSGYMFTYVKR